MTGNTKTLLESHWTLITNWSGNMNEAHDLLNATHRYTELSAEKITAGHLDELAAIIGGVQRLLREVEAAMDTQLAEITERIDSYE